MDRNDQIFFSAFGGSLLMAFIAILISHYGTSTSAPEWTQSILTGLAIFVAICVPLWMEKGKRDFEHRAAEIAIAAELRVWLRRTAGVVEENIRHQATQSVDGTYSIDIPEIPISSQQIAAIRTLYAGQLLDLIERRARWQQDIYATRYYDDDTDALMDFFDKVPHLFWSARRIYRELAGDLDLNEDTSRKSEIGSIKHAAEEAKRYWKLAKLEL